MKKVDNKALLEKARKCMREAVDWDERNREHALDDLKTLSGDQWPEDILKEREADKKPCLTINQLPQYVRQVTGDIRKLNPAVKIIAGDGQTNPETAKIIEGVVRGVEYASDASSVYELAAEQAASGGMGNFRVLTEYENDRSFNQVIRVDSIHNSLAVYWDPKARKSTRADAKFCFITDVMKQDDFDEAYPDASNEDAEHDGRTDGLEYWQNEGRVVVAEYIYKETNEVEIGLMRDGSVVDNPRAPMDFIKKRKVDRPLIMWAKISGNSVLEGPRRLAGKEIPVVCVTGEEMHVGDEVVRTSVIRFAKDPQRLYNYSRSTHAETVSIQPRAPYLVTLKQVKGLDKFWKEANKANRPYLPYNPDDKAPPPARSAPPVSSQGLMTELQMAAQDLQSTTGIYNAALGQESNENSGVAIRQRQIESDVSTSIYTDNLRKAIEQTGRIILGMLPEVYDTRRQVQVMGVEKDEKLVEINVPYMVMNGMQIQRAMHNDLTSGQYNVRVTVGPSYSTQRQEAVEGLMEFVRAVPAAQQVSGDIIARNMDFPGAEELAERLKAAIPPQLLKDEEPTPQQMQAQQQAMQAEQQQQEMAAKMAQATIAEKMADAKKAEADANEAQADALLAGLTAEEKRLELAMKSGAFDAAVQAAVSRVLQGVI